MLVDKLRRILRKLAWFCALVALVIGAYFLGEIFFGGTPEDARMQRRMIRG